MAASEVIERVEFEHLLAALTPENRLACEVSEATGLRIGDVLALKTADLAQRMTITEEKTGKKRRIYIKKELFDRLFDISGRFWVFEHRLDPHKHRTRQAVWKDLKRVAALFRVSKGFNITPHSCRKVFAVEKLKECGNMKKVQALLCHSSEAVTVLYAMADELTRRKHTRKRTKSAVKKP